MGLSGPVPRMFLGNAVELFNHHQHPSACLADWTHRFGKTYGYFIGHTPIICISDPDMLQEIFVTKFSHFHSRRPLPLQQHDLRHLLASTGDEWKRQRSVMQPTFSPNKLKEMRAIIDQCVTNLIEKLDEQKAEVEFDITSLLQRMSMDILLNCAFGINLSKHEKLSVPFFQRCLQVFEFSFFQTILTMCSLIVPELDFIWVTVFKYTSIVRLWLHDHVPYMNRFIDTDPNTWLLYHVEQIIKQRRLYGNERIDLLQSMIEATDASQHASSQTSTSPKARLNQDELLHNIYLFLLGGYETAATTLAYLIFILATHQNEQAHLLDEIERVYGDYDQIIKLEYLDWFIQETLRFFPIAPFIVNRQCNKECQIGPLKIERGTNITVDMYSLHYDDQLFGPVSPLKFYPERFRNKRHALAWLPFGAGPRNCIGMRFAMLEIKLALVQILHRYKILPGENTLSKFDVQERFVIAPTNGIWIRIERRET
ncbi:unnamed protein product [Adineta ricciae]|uniref:Cytochrome P450 n=1 Tax=Adineta ricciae TaxID=249248 RepID=A0A814XY76_ADIRI|nr:unnamed protein product [Adineta ricciae]